MADNFLHSTNYRLENGEITSTDILSEFIQMATYKHIQNHYAIRKCKLKPQ